MQSATALQVYTHSALAPYNPKSPISEGNARERLARIQAQFSNIPFIKERPPLTLLETLCRLDYSQFPLQPQGLGPRQVVWTPVKVLASSHSKKQSSIHCARRNDNSLEALIPLSAMHKNPDMKTGRFAFKVIFNPADQSGVELRPAFVLTAVYPTLGDRKAQLFDHEVRLRLHVNNLGTHFPQLNNWGFKEGQHRKGVAGIDQKAACVKLMMEDECFELNLEQLIIAHPEFLAQERNVLNVILRVLEALEKLYGEKQNGHVHCDLKPANIILRLENGQWIAYLTDLGLASPIGTKGPVLGTPIEWAPEIFAAGLDGADMEYRESVDIWQLGALAWEMLHKVVKEEQWAEYKKAQWNVGLVSYFPSKYNDPDVAFQRLFKQKYQKEKQAFFASLAYGQTYSVPKLHAYLRKKWEKELKSFEESILKDHPSLTWLQGMLKVNPNQRKSVQETLKSLRTYMESLPLQAPPAPVPQVVAAPKPTPPAATAEAAPPTPPSSKKTAAVAAETLQTEPDAAAKMMRSEFHSKISAPPPQDTQSAWFGWIWGWKPQNCSLQ